MTTSRREFLEATAAGLGSLSAVGLGADSVEACSRNHSEQWRLADGKRGPWITITLPVAGTALGRIFSVYGRFHLETTPSANPVECKLYLDANSATPVASGTVSWDSLL